MREESGVRRKYEHAFMYAFRGDGDMFELAMTRNLPRVRKRAVDPAASARGREPPVAAFSILQSATLTSASAVDLSLYSLSR